MSFTDPIYLVFLTSGFTVGFGHCIGMCGPIVVSLSLHLGPRRILWPHLLYNGGRITTYGVLGGIMGLTGSFTRVASGIAHVQKGTMIFAGVLIIVMGLGMSGWVPLGRLFGDYYNPAGIISRGFRRLSGTKSVVTFYFLGLLLGLLPCGPVYTALIAAARAGMEVASSTKGALVGGGVMLAFGLGTIPALLMVAKMADLTWLKWRGVIYKIGSILMVIVGVYFLIKGIRY
jgi:sulfite exporter TauE/SafE